MFLFAKVRAGKKAADNILAGYDNKCNIRHKIASDTTNVIEI